MPRLPLLLAAVALAAVVVTSAPAAAAPGQGRTAISTVRTDRFALDAGVAIETLVEATLPAETIPTGEAVLTFLRLTWEPSAVLSLPSLAPARSVTVEAVVAGAYALRVDVPLRVRRAARGAPDVPPGTEVTLGPGDAVVYPDNAAAQVLRNPGPDPLVTIGVGIFSTVASAAPAPSVLPAGVRIDELGFLDARDWARAGLAGSLVVTILSADAGAGGEPAAGRPGAPGPGLGRGGVGGGHHHPGRRHPGTGAADRDRPG